MTTYPDLRIVVLCRRSEPVGWYWRVPRTQPGRAGPRWVRRSPGWLVVANVLAFAFSGYLSVAVLAGSEFAVRSAHDRARSGDALVHEFVAELPWPRDRAACPARVVTQPFHRL